MKKMQIILLVVCFFLCCGCHKEDTGRNNAGDNAGSYVIYTVKGEKLQTVSYETQTTDSDILVGELLTQMGLSNSDVNDGKVYVESQSINNQIAYLSFGNEYLSMDSVTEVLFRASVVKTIAQVPGISYVYFYVNGNSLNYADGTLVGKMAASDFVDDTDDSLNSLAWTTITLYFANATGDRLVEKSIDAAYSKTMSLERLVIEQLISGPDDEDTGMKATLPSNLGVLGVSVKNDVCYLNLDGTFLSEIVDVSATIQIYSIVNSLTAIAGINEVQIQVNGDSNSYLREITLQQSFRHNLDLIESKEVETN